MDTKKVKDYIAAIRDNIRYIETHIDSANDQTIWDLLDDGNDCINDARIWVEETVQRNAE